MRVVFLEDVPGVAEGGDVKEVKNGFARNYLIPKNLAVPASHNALQRVNRLSEEAEVTRQKDLADMGAIAELLEGVQINIEMRAGSSGRLYGSVTNGIVAEKLSELISHEIDRRTVEISEPIRDLGTFDVNVRLRPEIKAMVKVLVYATGTDPTADTDAVEEAEDEAEGDAGEEIRAEVDPVEDAPAEVAEDINEDAEDESEEDDESE